ncbi:cytochrome c [Amaricoccus sp.]|uniref:c-type cytochrome n=1 Tax=Amaricoccus sp. TaxID=1872485 RepID=UPI002619D3F7|nr:cytochrome c [uncultured Amaricoccus sp.]
MTRHVLTLGLVAALSVPALAAEDPIAVRQKLMESNGASAAVAGGMMKGEIPYSPTVGKAAIFSLAATAAAFGSFFPEGTLDPAKSEASPKVWEDAAGFQAEIAKFVAATTAAREASGRAGPADLDAFKAAMGPVMGTCKSCHEGFRVDK